VNRHDVDWFGYWPAAPTPFQEDGSLDVPGIKELMELYLSQGVHGVLVNGSTGEWFSQSAEERRSLAEVARVAIGGKIPLVVGVTAYTPAEAISFAKHAAEIGADGVLATPPPYVHPTPDEIVAFYAEVSEATDLPFMVYNWPRGVAVDMAGHPDLMKRLAALPNVAAIKDSTGDWNRMVNTIEEVANEVRVFGSLTHRKGLALMMGLGGDGAIDGGGIGAPFAVQFFDAVRAGNVELAQYWVDRYQSISQRMVSPDYSGLFASPISQLKAAMYLLGHPAGPVRAPLQPVNDRERLTALSEILSSASLRVIPGRLEELVSGGEK